MIRLILIIAMASIAGVGGASAQSNTTPGNVESQGEAASQAQVATVGAGTANSVTTGASGPDQGGAPGPGELPPLPSADLCSDYEDQTTYASCLSLVLAEERDTP